jgi:hypothetical protein
LHTRNRKQLKLLPIEKYILTMLWPRVEALLTLLGNSLLWEAVLYIVGGLAASLICTY